jgi:hypothetical protein
MYKKPLQIVAIAAFASLYQLSEVRANCDDKHCTDAALLCIDLYQVNPAPDNIAWGDLNTCIARYQEYDKSCQGLAVTSDDDKGKNWTASCPGRKGVPIVVK